MSLHTILVLRALRELPPPADEVAKDLTDAFFQDLDASLREMGVGDTVVPKRMKKLAAAFYGRAHAYDAASRRGRRARAGNGARPQRPRRRCSGTSPGALHPGGRSRLEGGGP